ncbi:FGGY-family carbohydrate kinase [Clostridiaceae bacterium M8S5]|nr:FGGY-family carbohydrate kinase [Clostridiaceae bacterium M8S5]
MEQYVLAIDCGTQSIRGLIFDERGQLLAKRKREFKPYFSVNSGWAEQEATFYWKTVCNVCNELKNDYSDLWENLIAVSVTTQRDTCVVVDKNGEPLRPAILWLDQRMAKCEKPMPMPYRVAVKAINMSYEIESYRKKFKANWIKENEPEIWERTHKYLLLSGYINYKLTGEFVDSIASQIGHIPFEHKKKTWAGKLDIKNYVFELDRDKCPKLVKSGTIMGKISDAAIKETGIKEGLYVIASGSDKGCDTIGTGCIDETKGSISLGSTVTIQTTTERYYEVSKYNPPYPAVDPRCYNPEVQIYRGYWMISWFKREFAMKEQQQAKKLGVSPESLLDKRLKEIPPGSHGLILQPYWGAGIKKPEAKGAIIGFGDVHTRVHIYRAIIEGISYALLEGIENIQRKSGKYMKEIVLTGGGSVSDEICQITADALNRNVYRVQTHETSGLGAAIVCYVALGIYDSFDEAVKNMVQYKDEFIPDKKNIEIYSKLYNKVYKKMYPRMKKLYKSIMEITNYPE